MSAPGFAFSRYETRTKPGQNEIDVSGFLFSCVTNGVLRKGGLQVQIDICFNRFTEIIPAVSNFHNDVRVAGAELKAFGCDDNDGIATQTGKWLVAMFPRPVRVQKSVVYTSDLILSNNLALTYLSQGVVHVLGKNSKGGRMNL